MRRWEVIRGRRNEALDTLVYAFAARQPVGMDFDRRANDLSRVTGPNKAASVIRSKWLEQPR